MRRVEPAGFLAAREDGRLGGYAIFLPSLRRVQWQALRQGAAFRWALAFLRGAFGFRLSALGPLAWNKLLFLRSAGRFRSCGDAQLLNIAVHPSLQGRGIATALIGAGLDALRRRRVREVRLEVRPWNRSAVRLYERTGWREAGRIRDAGGEWIVMTTNPSTRSRRDRECAQE